jgi:hypothetical protein
MADIRFNISKGVKWKGSIILYIITLFAFLLQLVSVTYLIGLCFKKRKTFPKSLTEAWLLFTLVSLIVALCYWQVCSVFWQGIIVLFAIYFLLNSIGATLSDVFLAPNFHSGDIQVYDRQRWLILTLLVLVEVILSFAIIVLYYHDKFNAPISDSLTAIYFSAVSFLTLGYGDFYPSCPESKILLLCELGYFLLFLSLKLPIAISMISVKEYKDNNNKEPDCWP